jgi:NAD kinase
MNPFVLSVRPIVLTAGEGLVITLHLGDGTLTADGVITHEVSREDSVRVRPYREPLRVVRFGGGQRFFDRLRKKIGWGVPLVPQR